MKGRGERKGEHEDHYADMLEFCFAIPKIIRSFTKAGGCRGSCFAVVEANFLLQEPRDHFVVPF